MNSPSGYGKGFTTGLEIKVSVDMDGLSCRTCFTHPGKCHGVMYHHVCT